jgi:hypothetical protein
LRVTIMDQYVVILMSTEDLKCLDRFAPYLEGVFDFIEKTVSIEGFS